MLRKEFSKCTCKKTHEKKREGGKGENMATIVREVFHLHFLLSF